MTPPLSVDALLAQLDALGISYRHYRHPPVFTVEEAQRHCKGFPGAPIKNLFLRNKSGKMWLVTLADSQAVDLRKLGAHLGAGRLSFGSPERLMTYLGVHPGSVTPFAIVNDIGHAVQPVLDQSLLAAEWIHAHPLQNDQTLAIHPDDLLRFFEQLGIRPQLLDCAQIAPQESSA